MAVLNVDLGTTDVVVDATTAIDPTNIINIGVLGSHSLTVDGVSATVNSVATVDAVASPTFSAINDADLTIDYGLLGISALTAVDYNVGDASNISVSGPDLLGLTVGTQSVNFSGNGSGSFSYDKGLIDTVTSMNVNGFSWGDSVAATGFTFDDFSYNAASGNATLTLERGLFGADKFTFNLNGISSEMAALIEADPSSFFVGGEFVAPVCFLRGTMIATEDGEIAVENLQIGDKVQGHSGLREVRWIGYRHDWAHRIPQDRLEDFLPVLIKRDAISRNVPSSDLRVSPWHHLYVDGVLIRAKDLVNGRSILVDRSIKRISYYHVELDQFDVIRAHGLYSESYTDGGNRNFFHNTLVATLRPEDQVRREGHRPGFHAVRDAETIRAMHKRVADRAIATSEARFPIKLSA